MNITLWNTEWAKPKSRRGELVADTIFEGDPDVICVTEGYPDIFGAPNHVVTSTVDHGYGTTDGRRKVMLWSKHPWSEVDELGHEALPAGRFIAGTTESPLGLVRFIGVCIPWKDAHVRTGRRDRRPWEDHLKYIEGLKAFLGGSDQSIPTVLLGDFNQRIPLKNQPPEVYQALMGALQGRFTVVTGGTLPGMETQSIDHLAVTSQIDASSVSTFSNMTSDGTLMSDHFGLRIQVRRSFDEKDRE